MGEDVPKIHQHETTPGQDTATEEALANAILRRNWMQARIAQLDDSLSVLREQRRKLELDLVILEDHLRLLKEGQLEFSDL